MRLALYAAGFLLLAGSAFAAPVTVIQDPSNVNRNMAVNADGSINVNASITGGGDATAANQVITNAGIGAPADTTCGTATGTCDIIQLQKYLNSVAGQGVGSTAASVPAQAIYNGCRAATTNPTAVTDGQLVGPMCSKGGKAVVDLFAPSDLRVQGKVSGTDTSAHTIIAAGAGSLKNYITGIQCGRTDAGTSPIVVTFSDAQSTPMIIPDAGNGGGNNFNLVGSPLVTAAATAFTFTSGTGVTTLYCSAQGYQAP